MTDDRPTRLMQVIARLNIGGPAIYVALVAQRLALPEYGYECLLVTGPVGADEGDMTYYAEARGVQPRLLPELGRAIHPVRDLLTIWKLYRLMRAERPHVVHTHTMKAGFTGRIAARLAGVPVIVHTMHGHSYHGYWGKAKTWLFLQLERLATRCGHRTVTLTEGLRRDLVEVYRVSPAAKTVVLPLALDLHPFRAQQRRGGAFRAAHGIPADAPLIGFVGRLVPIKNVGLFLRAAAQALAACPSAYGVVVGDGELRAALEAEVAALGLGARVIFTGWVQDLAPLYSDLDVVVSSSLNEGTPVALIEALTAGCRVVATAVGGVPDLLEGGALGALVPSEDEAALAAAILAALDAGPADEAARDLMLARYGIARLAHDLDALYRAVWAARS